MLKSTLFATALFGVTFSFSQVVLDSSDLSPVQGEVFPFVESAFMSEGSAGSNISWDFGSLPNNGATQTSYESATAAYPSTNITEITDYGSQIITAYLEIRDTGHYLHTQAFTSTDIDYQVPIKLLTFPLQMSTDETNSFSSNYTSGGQNYMRTGTTNIKVDAFGTLITPTGTFTDVLRAKITTTYQDVSSANTYDYESVEFAWFKSGFHRPLLSFVETTSTAYPTQFVARYLNTISLSTPNIDVENQVTIYPNPVIDEITIQTESEFSQVQLFSATGELNMDISAINGGVINLESLDSGVYFLVLTKESGSSVTKKVIKK